MLKNQPKFTAASAPVATEIPPVNGERMCNYLRVATGVIPDALEELTHLVNYMPRSRYAWYEALAKVDDPDESPGRRAACFHLLIEESSGDALTGDPVAWQSPFAPGSKYETQGWMRPTPPEQIADIVQRIRKEFPGVVAAEKAGHYELTQAHIDSLGITEEDIAEAIREARREEQCLPSE